MKRMTKILILYYSQSGQAALAAGTLARVLNVDDVNLTVERIAPVRAYPYPWRSPIDFFGVLPECHLGPLPELSPIQTTPQTKFDLVFLIYQVWFLAPSPPIQSFLNSPLSAILEGSKVVTVSVSRAMWHSASETMKELLDRVKAKHIDHIALTHQGPAWATLVSVPRAALTGASNGLWGLFPPAGLGESELKRLEGLAETILGRRDEILQKEPRSLLTGREAAPVNVRSLLPEFLGRYYFLAGAYSIRFLRRAGKLSESIGLVVFIVVLFWLIVAGIPLLSLLQTMIGPLIRRWTQERRARLEEPSGGSIFRAASETKIR